MQNAVSKPLNAVPEAAFFYYRLDPNKNNTEEE